MFITTSSFSREAIEYAGAVGACVVLIDGRELARLMTQTVVMLGPIGWPLRL